MLKKYMNIINKLGRNENATKNTTNTRRKIV